MAETLTTHDASPSERSDAPTVTARDSLETGVWCPRCERISLDLAYCEHCQAELLAQTNGSTLPPGLVPPGSTAPVSGPFCSEWSLAALSVGWPDDPSRSFEVAVDGSRFRVRAIRPELWLDLAPDVRARQAVTRAVLPPVHFIELGGGAIIAAESWHVEAASTTPHDITELLAETLRVSRLLNVVLTDLHASGYVWLEFDPQAIEVRESQVRVTNLDWRLFPAGQCPSRLARISPQYSPPEVCRFHDDWIGPKTDVYHLALFIYYRLAGLWPGGFAGRGLEAFGFEVPPLRVFRPDLPVGLWPVLRRALAINVAHRPATTSELLGELERAAGNGLPTGNMQAGLVRETSSTSLLAPSLTLRVGDRESVAVELGWHTTAGRAKAALGAVNQDRVVVVSEAVGGHEVWLLIVADGVTHARIGAGERASQLACDVLLASIRSQLASLAESEEPRWPMLLDAACLSASDAIVQDALSLPDRPVPTRDNDLMSTTALIGVLDGDELHLANVGDSRAYLVANGRAEQLTVDGDVAMSQLALGTPPEQVQELGAAGKPLRFCLGACRETDDGNLVVDPTRARPQISRWRLRSDDAIVLCTDGLVEECVFLEPEDLATILEGGRDLTSQQLAEQLVAAADARQRLPSPTEPNAYGDNITCVVLKFVEGRSRATPTDPASDLIC